MKNLLLLFSLLLMSCSIFAQTAGDIIITEMTIDAGNGYAEWIELYNTTGSDIDIEGWSIIDLSSSSRSHVIANGSPLLVPSNSYVVIGQNLDPIDGVTPIYTYGSGSGTPSMNDLGSFNDGTGGCNNTVDPDGVTNNEVDGMRLETAMAVTIDEVGYDFNYSSAPIGFPDNTTLPGYVFTGLQNEPCDNDNEDLDEGRSIQYLGPLDASGATENDLAVNWSYSSDSAIAGTPGAATNNAVVLSVQDQEFTSKNFSFFKKDNFLNFQTKNDLTVNSLNIYSITGASVYSSVTNKESIDISSFANGFYVAILDTNQGDVRLKFAK